MNILLPAFFVGLVSVGFAQESAGPPKTVSFPYIAEITADDVYIRSGPGTNYYPCGKLNQADRVKVVASKFTWSQVVPPTGCFSWISMQYVSLDPNNPTIGIVTSDLVRVYAGSEYWEPIRSDRLQLKLNSGDKVKLMGAPAPNGVLATAGYYKIVPPEGVYLWVSTRYTKPLSPVVVIPPTVGPSTVGPSTVGPPTVGPSTVGPPTKTDVNTPAVIPTVVSVEAKKLAEYYALQKQLQAERAKPIDRQDYTNIRKALEGIVANKEAGKAGHYAQLAIQQIKRFELALAVDQAVRLQDTDLQQTRERIEKARLTKQLQVQDLGRFAAIGQLQTSSVYGPEPVLKRYRIIDGSGKTVCYALATGAASTLDLSKAVGHKVGLIGTIEPHPQTSGVLVRFTEVVELQ